jgi:hypothetical protein
MDTGGQFTSDSSLLGGVTIESLARSHPRVVRELRNREPVATAASFAALLISPELQANCYRLEYLVHLALAYCEGTRQPTQDLVQRSFKALGDGVCGMAEDPSEDVFVSLVNTPRGNFRVFDGIREGNGFYLQRILNIVESIPSTGRFLEIREAVEGILKLSEAVANRVGLAEGLLGQEMPLRGVPKRILNQIALRRSALQFSQSELRELQISESVLATFEFRPSLRTAILSQSPGNTELERYPIVRHRDAIFLLLPTAVGSAITRFVIYTVLSVGLGESFETALAADFAKLFVDIPLLGGRSEGPIRFQRIPGGRATGMVREIDPGRFLHLVFFVDGLAGFEESGLDGPNQDPELWGSIFEQQVTGVAADMSGRPGFRSGVSLLVVCGYGRAAVCLFKADLPRAWRMEVISAHDLVTLSWLSDFDALSFWRLLDAQDAIAEQGVELMNVNGLLNLVAWSRYLKGHLVPHGKLPSSPDDRPPTMIMIQQNMLRELRHSVSTDWSPRRLRDVDGCWVRVIKLDKTYFEEDNRAPLFGSRDDVLAGRLRGIYVAPKRSWWLEISAQDGAPAPIIFEYWKMLCGWLARAAPVLDAAYLSLPPSPISFQVRFEELLGAGHGSVKAKNETELRDLITIAADGANPKVQITVGAGYDDGFSQPENVAERVIVEAIVVATARIAGERGDLEGSASLVAEICPDPDARHIHRFEARSFRDYARSEIHENPILVDQMDDATYRLGLGWRARSRGGKREFTEPKECTAALNDVVQVVLEDLSEMLRGLDRKLLVRDLLLNHERAVFDRDHWNRTTQAVLALRKDKNAAVRAIVKHQGELNACTTACRILLEAAICECPLAGGGIPGRLDISRLMALVMAAFYLGGWSDAIHWGAAEPLVRITPLGDVHMDHTFMNVIYEPFGRFSAERDVGHAVKSYSALYIPAAPRKSVYDVFELRFLDAWKAEFGIPLEGLLAFLGALEKAYCEPPKAVAQLSRSALAGMFAESADVSIQQALDTLVLFTLCPRPAWRAVRAPFTDKDWYPWRFRRRLSMLRRPFVQIDLAEDPTIAFAPGLVGDSVRAVVERFESGEIPSSQDTSLLMQQWIGHANNVQRTEFNSSVAERMAELGWQVRKEVKLTWLLERWLDRNYGDVDVLAWRPESGRVLAIECKDVQYNKTLGEVAEQLADFRGEIRPDGKPDLLRKHLDRLDILNAHSAAVSQKLNLTSTIALEGHLVFKNPVPMKFAWKRMADKVRLSLFSELDRL